MSGKKLQSRGVFSGYLFKMGWFGGENGDLVTHEEGEALAGRAGKPERANFTSRAGGHCKFARARWIVRSKRRGQVNVYGRECSPGRPMNIVDVDMNVYDHHKTSYWSRGVETGLV